MSCNQPLIATVILAALAHAGCDRIRGRDTSTIAGTVTLVNRVTSDVGCAKGPNCQSTVESALRHRLHSVAIKMHPERQVVDLEFENTATAFSSASFRQAVAEGGGEVLKIGIEACGTVDTVQGQSWITSGSTRLLLDGPGPFITGTEICVSGELRDQVSPPRLVPGNVGS
jgi:hypothetical protein